MGLGITEQQVAVGHKAVGVGRVGRQRGRKLPPPKDSLGGQAPPPCGHQGEETLCGLEGLSGALGTGG